MSINLSQVRNCYAEDIDYRDYPDFCDAHISYGEYEEETGELRQLTEDEIDEINYDHSDFVYDVVWNQIH